METGEKPQPFNYLFGLVCLAVVFCVVWLLWFIFMDPNKSWFKLYTPMYGFSLVVTWFSAIILMTTVADYYPFHLPGKTTFFRGILLTAVSIFLMLFLVYVFFWGFIGKFGVAYFSPKSIVAGGGIGAEAYNAREIASRAIVYFFGAFLWWALVWRVGFGDWPWLNATRGTVAWSRLVTVLLFSIVTYSLVFHPHVCYLFYPAQTKAGVEPWWISLAKTGDAFFNLGLILCILFWIVISDLLWEGRPWSRLERNGQGTLAKGLVTFLGTFILGVILFVILLKVMNIPWGEAFEGGQYTDGPNFRYIHAGEIAGFFILAAFIWSTYFNNAPRLSGLWARGIIRTAISLAGGILIYLFYYSPATTFFLGKVPGVGQPDDSPLVWTILFLSIILVHRDFGGTWPLRKKAL
jgi:amino acid transporter, AAT family